MINLVSDYKKNFVEARENRLTLHNINNVDKSVIMTVAGAANSRIDYSSLGKKGDADMCTVFEETRLEGKLEGRLDGEAKGIIETGYDFGLSDNDILDRLQKKLNVSEEVAQGYIEMFGKQTV